MATFWFYVSGFGSLLSVVFWLRDEWRIIREAKKYYRILYPAIFVILSVVAIRQYQLIDEMTKIENEAAAISKNWPSLDGIKFISKGERLGIIMAGQTFLEKYKRQFPDTYKDIQELKKGRLGDYTSKTDFSKNSKEYDDLEDVCGATITIVRNLAKK
ncbi:MAG: hypothetical protein KF744_08085 [Taibaiella sp.]|nr:hypothetical protein [Taibaiella sp.]